MGPWDHRRHYTAREGRAIEDVAGHRSVEAQKGTSYRGREGMALIRFRRLGRMRGRLDGLTVAVRAANGFNSIAWLFRIPNWVAHTEVQRELSSPYADSHCVDSIRTSQAPDLPASSCTYECNDVYIRVLHIAILNLYYMAH